MANRNSQNRQIQPKSRFRNQSTISSVYIADGVADDCEELIHQCVQAEKLNYNVFCNIFKDMNFAAIFHGRARGAELAEYSEEVVNVAKQFMVKNTSNYEESVAGLFLVYALINIQPFPNFVNVRITSDDLDAIFNIEQIAREQKRYDVLYILGSILIKGPVHYQLTEREYGMEKSVCKYLNNLKTIDQFGVKRKGVFYRQNEELDLLRELSSLSRRYAHAKSQIPGPHKPLNYTDEHVPNELAASLKQLISGTVDNSGSPKKSHEEAVHSIKERAMKETVNPLRHLASVADNQSKPPQKIKGEKANTKKQTKIPETITKPVSPKKKKSKIKKSRQTISDSSNSDTDINHSSHSENDIDTDTDSDLDNTKTMDAYLEKLKHLPSTSKGVLKVETLPVLIRTTEDESYEIELLNRKTEQTDGKTDMPNLTDVSIDVAAYKAEQEKDKVNTILEKLKEQNSVLMISEEDGNYYEVQIVDDTVSEGHQVSEVTQLPEEREAASETPSCANEARSNVSKRLKDRLNKMGMLDVAGLKDGE